MTAEDVATLYHDYDREHGVTPQTRWIIGRRALLRVRSLRDFVGHYLYSNVITPTKIHHTLMGLPFELSETDVNALYLEG